ncbi:unnamed protein product [Rotaria magnacalcarata]|uniref:FLYWCH-type domain-containing protein n=1 Tax=Rotaria magnacalcarata TaxID=392030 RepID=A0A816NSD3_9BILA|nr:unnamed protein product [Rotaria magnacalcarata]
MLNIGNFIFKLNKTTSTKKYYRGVDPHCTVTVHTDVDDVMLNINGDHCHSCEPEEIQIRKFKQAVNARTVNETTPIPQIYDEEATRIDLSTLPIASLTSQREGCVGVGEGVDNSKGDTHTHTHYASFDHRPVQLYLWLLGSNGMLIELAPEILF